MKTAVNVLTGRVLFSIQDGDEVDLKSDEVLIDAQCDLPFDQETEMQVWDFNTQTFSIQPKAE